MDYSKQHEKKLKWFGKAVRHVRKQNDMTIQDLTDESDINEKYISRIENGQRNITLTTLFKICDGLDIEPSKLHEIAEEIQRNSK
ncbi:helix-turn-helix domain-containing protein [Salipaludibacillus daqingensis]|uniref:helix-turn-helix domain-containing protein n=1 Tax=Salipaludibacillus daqingensis TaxID=3041001 RepID=UPI0024755C97|nr:helix-turn-helix transcriptional regulator [Salipaludibacillus daqingensis]